MIDSAKVSKKEQIREILDKKDVRIYFIGIGGVSMSSLAILMKKRGAKVSGSDIRESKIVDMLKAEGITVKLLHTKEAVISARPDIVVFSLAVDRENPEYKAAEHIGALTVSRAELLGALMDDFGMKIGISGSHGKSTVTAMLGSVFSKAEYEPTVLCGAEISTRYGLVEGNTDYLIYEACEYGDSFLKLRADIQIFLNLELDHTDYFKSIEDIRESFLKCANNTEGACIVNLDCINLRAIVGKISTRVHTFSKDEGAEYRYDAFEIDKARYAFKLYRERKFIGEYSLGIRGEFNVPNAVAAAITADIAGIPYEVSSEAIAGFYGIKRRLELINQTKAFDVFYDYAHHPSEINASYTALRKMGYKDITVIFAPHTYSRTASFFDRFIKELVKFDTVYVLDIYGARENAIVGVNSSSLASAVSHEGTVAHAVCENEAEKIIADIKNTLTDCVVLMGAGDVGKYKEEFMKIQRG